MKTISSDHKDSQILPRDHRPIVFFDGECVMCNRFVDFLIHADPSARILIAPLQGETAKIYLPPLPDQRQEWTIYYLDQSGLWDRSEAFVRICQHLKNWVMLFSILGLIPLPLRDYGYGIIASRRYQIFGQLDQCRIPTPAEQTRFLL